MQLSDSRRAFSLDKGSARRDTDNRIINNPFNRTMAHLPTVSFEHQNQGLQVGQNYAPINAEFYLPPGRFISATSNQAMLTSPEQPETTPQPFAVIPFCRDPDFVNRGDILDRIDRRCSEPAGRVALVGLGGVG